MGDYNRNNRSGGGRSGGGRFGGGGDFRRRDPGRREKHKAVCDECGKDCVVPFRPSGNKPVFCSDCFEKNNGGSSRRPARRDSGRGGFGERDNSSKQLLEQVTSINSKLDRILKVLEGKVTEKPAPKKPKAEKKVKEATKVVKKVKEIKVVTPKVESVLVEKVIPIQEVIEKKKESKK